MEKRAVIGIVLVIAVLALLAWWLWPTPYYSDNPKTWIDQKPGNVAEINVDKVTKGKGFLDPVGLQWNDGTVITAFGYDGLYQGKVFSGSYADPQTHKKLMSINPAMTPNDGVVEGFIIERLQGDTVRAFVFVDEDWKRALGQSTLITWGAAFQNAKPFVFNEISPGMYLDSVIDDPARFEDEYRQHTGGVVVGNANPDDVLAQHQAGITVIRTV